MYSLQSMEENYKDIFLVITFIKFSFNLSVQTIILSNHFG